MSDADQWFLIIMLNVVSAASLIATETDWYERPPLSWCLAAFYWTADHLFRPWLDPVLRWMGVEP